MKKLIYAVVLSVLFQSCYSYKAITPTKIKEGKNYLIELESTSKIIEAKCELIKNDTYYFRINNNQVKVPVGEIKSVERKKVSAVLLVGGVAAATGVGILWIESNTKENIIE